jgi:transcriptional regulator with XRE-family HTH domain
MSRARLPSPPSSGKLATGSGAFPATEFLTLEQALGLQIRTLRRRAEISAADLANGAHISGGMLSKMESGQISPSLSTIQAVAQSLNVPISQLFARFDEQRDCSYVPAGQGVLIERRGTKSGHQYNLLGHGLDGPIVAEPYLITLKEEAQPYTGFHHGGIEFIYMLTGEVVYRHGDQSYHLHPGDAMLFDSGALHGPETLIKKPMTYLSIIIYLRND